jgi:hypothetical protein
MQGRETSPRVVPKDVVALSRILDAARESQEKKQPVIVNY